MWRIFEGPFSAFGDGDLAELGELLFFDNVEEVIQVHNQKRLLIIHLAY